MGITDYYVATIGTGASYRDSEKRWHRLLEKREAVLDVFFRAWMVAFYSALAMIDLIHTEGLCC